MLILTSLVNKIKANFKLYAIAAVIILIGLFGFKACRKHQQKAIQVATNPILTPDQKEKIIINEPEHKITIITKNPDGSTKTTDTHFSDTTVITEDNNGKLSIYNPQWDFKFHPTIGAGISDKPKLFVGVSPLGWKKLDLNIGLETDCQKLNETAINMSLGYNVHNATYLFLGVNNHKDIEGGLRFRF